MQPVEEEINASYCKVNKNEIKLLKQLDVYDLFYEVKVISNSYFIYRSTFLGPERWSPNIFGTRNFKTSKVDN